jgi:hypothetical protein
MKHLLGTMTLLLLLVPAHVQGGCSDAETNGFDCYRYALRAVRESSLATVRDYAKKSELAAESAQSIAEDCSCYNAEVEFRAAYLSARNAVKAETIEESKEHLRLVLRAAEAGTEAAESCR